MRPGGVDQGLATDFSHFGLDAHDGAALQCDARDADAGREAGALLAGARLVGHGEVVGLQVAIARAPEDRLCRRRDQARPAGAGSGVIQELDLETGRPRGLHETAELLDAGVLERDPEAADLAPGGPRRGPAFEGFEGRDRIHREPDALDRAAHLADQARRLRRGDRRQRRFLLDQQHIPPAGLGQAVGDRAADGTTADDHDLSVPELRHRQASARMVRRYQPRKPRTFCSRSGDSGPGW